jgi:3-oxoacyl-[acyl-carrier-protein] synthase-1
MEQSFIAPSINIDVLDEKAAGIPVVREMRHAELTTVMSNSFGFGGTNATLVMRKYKS